MVGDVNHDITREKTHAMSTTSYEVTKAQFNRTVSDLREIAGERGIVQLMDSTFYFFGSEIATLRLLKKYRKDETARAEYSVNRATSFFSFTISNFSGEFIAE